MGAGAGEVYGHGTCAGVRQEVIKAVKVSGGGRLWRWGKRWLVGSANQQMDSLSTGLRGQSQCLRNKCADITIFSMKDLACPDAFSPV